MLSFIKEKIGVIGGCGVAAANELMRRVEQKLTELGCADDSQQPEMILYQATLAPNRIAYANGKSSNSFASYFIEVGQKLKICGATICCIACNTAHCEIEQIEAAVGLPFINIITETLHFITQNYPAAKNVGVLGSSGTKKAKIYQKFSNGHEIIFPDDALQNEVDMGIAAVKRGLPYTDLKAAEQFFLPAMDQLIAKGADVIILGCTEIPLAIKFLTYKNKPIVDTLSVLADACIKACRTED